MLNRSHQTNKHFPVIKATNMYKKKMQKNNSGTNNKWIITAEQQIEAKSYIISARNCFNLLLLLLIKQHNREETSSNNLSHSKTKKHTSN